MSVKALALPLIAALMTGCALFPSSEERKQIEKPIPDTYEPLSGADWNHRYSPELEELRAWQEAKEASAAAYEPEPGTISAGPRVPEERIHEPEPAVPSRSSDPRLEEDEDSLRIRE